MIAQFVSYEQLLNWAKVDVQVIKSGKFKDTGSPFREMSKAELDYLQKVIDNVHSQFTLAVSESRDIDLKVVKQISDGRIFTGQQALDLNLVDEIGTISDAIRLAGDMGGIEEDPNVVYYPKKKRTFLDLLLSKLETHGLSGFPLKQRFGLFYIVDIIN